MLPLGRPERQWHDARCCSWARFGRVTPRCRCFARPPLSALERFLPGRPRCRIVIHARVVTLTQERKAAEGGLRVWTLYRYEHPGDKRSGVLRGQYRLRAHSGTVHYCTTYRIGGSEHNLQCRIAAASRSSDCQPDHVLR